MRNRWLGLAGFLGIAFAFAALGGVATSSSVGSWYQTLVKPTWNPPSWVFGPVWTLLYTAMAVAAWRVWLRPEHPQTRAALGWYFTQLGLNASWSLLFFGLRRPDLALVEIGLLLGCLVVVQLKFRRIDPIAGLLWMPYVAWVAFAAVLNGTIWWLNR